MISNRFPGGNSDWEPPDPILNSEVKTLSADGSVGSPHVRVGHRQAGRALHRAARNKRALVERYLLNYKCKYHEQAQMV